MKKILPLLVLFLSLKSFAQWNINTAINTPICTEAAKQIDPRIMEDGVGGAYITWKDYRPTNALPDIYIQRIDAKGNVKWISNGIGICTDIKDQSTPAICSDMKGGAIVAWSDWRTGIERDLYAQRIDSNGNIKWMVNGANISNLSNREHSEKITSDGKGGVIIAFEKQIAGVWDVWAQRLDSSGNKMWGAGGIRVCPTDTNKSKRNHRIAKDRSGGAIISWQDNRTGADNYTNTNYDIYAQRINANGILLWGNTGKPISVGIGDQLNAKIDLDSASNGAIIAWQDTRISPDYDIYMQRIDSNGNAKWTTNGIVVCNAVGNQSALDFLTIDATGEAVITWKDSRSGSEDIYAQKINSAGLSQWTANGIAICNSTLAQINPNICSDQNKGAIITWQDSSATTGWDIKAQHINNAGQALWTSNGLVVSNAIDEQNGPKNVTDNKGGTIICWQDKRTGTNDIYAHHLFSTGLFPSDVKNSISENEMEIYPNPFSSMLDIRCSINGLKVVTIFNLLGAQVFKSNIENQLQLSTINLSYLNQGVYFLKIETVEGILTKKIIKQ